MNVLVVGNVIKDVYLNLDSRTESFETDKNNTDWLNLSFDASHHHFFSRIENYGGSAVTLEILQNLGVSAKISDSNLNFSDNDPSNDIPGIISAHRYILVNNEKVTYFSPTNLQKTVFIPPEQSVDYLYLDRSAELDSVTTTNILNFLNSSPNTKLVLYVHNLLNPNINGLIPLASLIFAEQPTDGSAILDAPEFNDIDPSKIISISENSLSYLELSENISVNRVHITTHLSTYSTASATILGCFILGYSVEESLKFARLNVEESKLNSSLSLEKLQEYLKKPVDSNNLELIAKNLVLSPKGILAADESGGSIQKKFANLNIPDTYDNRRDYRNLFFTTEKLGDYVNGVILFDETARQLADNGQNFVDFLTSSRIIPGIKVDQGLAQFEDSEETFTKGLDGLEKRLREYHHMGLRFAKWRAAFEIRLNEAGEILTPTDRAINENSRILADYAFACQESGLVPIVEPEVVYDGNYPIDICAQVTSKILDKLFEELNAKKVNLAACILKVNMILAGKQFSDPSSSEEIGRQTAEVLKEHVPEELAGVVFLSGGQTPEEATKNLASVLQNGPFPWPVTFSFARALQDPALYAWNGDNANAKNARAAFAERLAENQTAIKG